MNKALPSRAQIVIIGGGIVGCSVAYHLAQLGRIDVVLLEQGKLSCGTTWHAAGLVGQLRSTENLTRLIRYSTELYERLESETGFATGWKRTGSVSVARTPERMAQLKRTVAVARSYGVEGEVISAKEAGERWPVMRTDDLAGAVWLPGDGKANPSDLTQALARGASQRGATIVERVKVTGFDLDNGAVRRVRTSRGDVECEIVVNCAGQWAKEIGRLAGVTVPLHPAEHYYIVTEQIEGVHPDLPVLRDPDGYTYYKEEVGGLVVGGFEPDAKPWGTNGIPEPFEFQLLDEDWDQFAILMENAIQRVPALDTTGVKKFYNGPESFTPDNGFLLGEAPELRGFFVGAGFNSMGIASAGGAGKALAEWIIGGEPSMDLWPVDIRRFARWSGNDAWLHDRVKEVLGLHYAMPWPNRELGTARPLRRSPVYHVLRDAGACFGTTMGFERVNYFGPPPEYSYRRQNWHDIVAAEHRAAREDVALFDQTSSAKFTLKGRDAEDVLQWLCAGDVAVAPGRAVHTGMLGDRGGYESTLTVTRVAADEYLIVTGSGQTTRDFDYLQRGIRSGQHASLVDVTSAYAVFGLMGPRSRELLSTLTGADLSNEAFPHGTSRLIDLGYATVRATRVTHVGELGWELYVPAEFAVTVYETLLERRPRQAGYYAIESLRIEKGYRAWGSELTPDRTPVEAGLASACKLKTGVPFRGRDVVERQRAEGVSRRLVSLTLDDPEPQLWGGELLLRDGDPAGYVTSAAYGHTLGRSVALGYVQRDGRVAEPDYLFGAAYQIDAAGDLYDATVSLRAPYDPTSQKVKS